MQERELSVKNDGREDVEDKSFDAEGGKSMIRQHMKIFGRVQGVGFRYRASYVANGLGLTGWVRNDWDGSVELEVQGTIEQINRMLSLVNQGTYIMIEDIKRKELPCMEHESGFHVRS